MAISKGSLFFQYFLLLFFFKDKNYIRFILSVSVICLLALGIFFSGNRMPLILFIFGLSLILFLNLKLRKILLLSFLITILFLKFIFSSNEYYKSQYITFYTNFINIMTFSKDDLIDLRINPSGPVTKMILEEYNEKKLGTKEAAKSKVNHYDVKWESNHRRIFLSALDTWRLNKLLGNGIKSFRITCPKINRPGVNLGEDLYPEKINRLCANHPHNYYLEILTDTGSAGFVLIFIIGFLFIFFIIKNLKYLKENNLKNLILLSAILCLCLEGVPLRSSGSIFTSSNATYLILIGSIVLSNKKLLKTKI